MSLASINFTCVVKSHPSSRQTMTDEPCTSIRSTIAPDICRMFWSWNKDTRILFIKPATHVCTIITARKRSLGQGNIFTPVCHSVHRGEGGCLVPGGSVPGGDLLPGGCLVETPPDGYCCGRYASYWNAFL